MTLFLAPSPSLLSTCIKQTLLPNVVRKHHCIFFWTMIKNQANFFSYPTKKDLLFLFSCTTKLAFAKERMHRAILQNLRTNKTHIYSWHALWYSTGRSIHPYCWSFELPGWGAAFLLWCHAIHSHKLLSLHHFSTWVQHRSRIGCNPCGNRTGQPCLPLVVFSCKEQACTSFLWPSSREMNRLDFNWSYPPGSCGLWGCVFRFHSFSLDKESRGT